MRHGGRHVRRRTLATLIALALAAPTAAAPPEWLSATVDSIDVRYAVRAIRDADGLLWLSIDDLQRLGIPARVSGHGVPDGVSHDGLLYVEARTQRGLVRIDPVAERVHFESGAVRSAAVDRTPGDSTAVYGTAAKSTAALGTTVDGSFADGTTSAVPSTRPKTPAYLTPAGVARRSSPLRPVLRDRAWAPVPATRPPTPDYLSPPPWPPEPAGPAVRASDDRVPDALSPPPPTRPATPDRLSSFWSRRHEPVVVPSPATAPSVTAGAASPSEPGLASGRNRDSAPHGASAQAVAPVVAAPPRPTPVLPPMPAPGAPPPIPVPAPPPGMPPPPRPIAAQAGSRAGSGEPDTPVRDGSAPPAELPVAPPDRPPRAATPPPAEPEPASREPVPTADAPSADPAASAPSPVTATPSAPATGPAIAQPHEEWFPAIRNHVDTSLSVLVVTDGEGRPWIRTRDLRMLDIRLPDAMPRLHAGETFVPLDALGLRSGLDRTSGRLHLNDGPPPAPAEGALIADVVVNRQALPEAQVIEWRNGEPALPPEALEAAGLVVPEDATDADGWVPISAIAGDHYVLDTRNLLLDLTAPPERFATRRIDARNNARRSQHAPAVAPGLPAFLLGYDLAAGRTPDGDRWTSALLDAGASFGRTGCSSRHLWRDDRQLTRLDTVCTLDWPERRLSVVLGDTASRDWGQSGTVSYGGIRIGTDFGLQPYLLTQPLLGLSGTARLPSVLEVWTEQQLALRTEIAPGQFVIDGLPALTGRGDIAAVVIDPLGRQTRITSSFYSDPSLLAAGLQDWAVEAGRLRTGLGTTSDHYGDSFAQAGLRRGMTDAWTTTVHAARTDDLQVLGWGNHVRLGLLGVAELDLAASEAGGVRGHSRTAGYSFRRRDWGFGIRQIRRDAGYADLAWPEPGSAPLRELQVYGNLAIGTANASLAGFRREQADVRDSAFVRLAVGMPLLRGHLSLSAVRTLEPQRDTGWSATWTLPFGRGSVSAWAEGDGRSVRPGVAIQRNQPLGRGYGYRLAAQDTGGGDIRASGDLRWRTDVVAGGVTVWQTPGGSSLDASVGGALVWSEQGMDAAGARDGSYAVVKLPAPGVRVYRDHQWVATTGTDGTAIVTRLRPFEVNRLSVAADDLPLDTQIERASLDIVPGRRQVVAADFGASSLRSLTLRVRDAAGAYPAPGSLAHLLPDESAVQVGHEGLLYLEYATRPEAVRIDWGEGAHCMIPGTELPERQAPGDIADIRCQGARP